MYYSFLRNYKRVYTKFCFHTYLSSFIVNIIKLASEVIKFENQSNVSGQPCNTAAVTALVVTLEMSTSHDQTLALEHQYPPPRDTQQIYIRLIAKWKHSSYCTWTTRGQCPSVAFQTFSFQVI